MMMIFINNGDEELDLLSSQLSIIMQKMNNDDDSSFQQMLKGWDSFIVTFQDNDDEDGKDDEADMINDLHFLFHEVLRHSSQQTVVKAPSSVVWVFQF